MTVLDAALFLLQLLIERDREALPAAIVGKLCNTHVK